MTLREIERQPTTYRPITTIDIPRTADLLSRAYAHYYAPEWLVNQYQEGGRYDWHTVRVLETANNDIVATVTAFERVMCLHGGELGAVLGTGLGVAPEQRRRGYAHQVVAGLLDELYARKMPVMLVYPFSAAFAISLGFGLVNLNWVLEIPPNQLRVFPEYTHVRRATLADRDAIRDCYTRAQCLPTHNGWLSRNAWEWEHWVWRDEPEAVVYTEGTKIEGYLLYTLKPEGNLAPVRVREWVSESDAAWRGLTGFLGALGEQATMIHYIAPTDFPLWLTTREPFGSRTNNIDWTYWPVGQFAAGFLLRLVHLPTALRQRRYPEDVDMSFVLRVHDEVLPSNGQSLWVRIADGRAEVTEMTNRVPTVEIDCATFSQLFVGFISAERARMLGRLQVDDATCTALTRAFASPPLFHHDADVF
jgi:predicted acetyltransferase